MSDPATAQRDELKQTIRDYTKNRAYMSQGQTGQLAREVISLHAPGLVEVILSAGWSKPSPEIRKTEWVDCPICGESDMSKTFPYDEPVISCSNHACGSNGGTNFSAVSKPNVTPMKFIEDAIPFPETPQNVVSKVTSDSGCGGKFMTGSDGAMTIPAQGDGQSASPETPQADPTKEWRMNMAALEGNAEIGAGHESMTEVISSCDEEFLDALVAGEHLNAGFLDALDSSDERDHLASIVRGFGDNILGYDYALAGIIQANGYHKTGPDSRVPIGDGRQPPPQGNANGQDSAPASSDLEACQLLGFGKSSDAFHNLGGAIIDIERTGICDSVGLKTLKRVEAQLGECAAIFKGCEIPQTDLEAAINDLVEIACSVCEPEQADDKANAYTRLVLTHRFRASLLSSRRPIPDTPAVDQLRGLDTDTRVRFYEHDFYVLSNFSAFNLEWCGYEFDTSEAAYHWIKFDTIPGCGETNIQTSIRRASSAHEAFKIAERHRWRRRGDWDSVKVDIMRDILRAKAAQHEYVRRKLLDTGDRELVEDSWRDDFWGWGPNRDGQNMLGKLWMEVRAEIRAAASEENTPAVGEPTDAELDHLHDLANQAAASEVKP